MNVMRYTYVVIEDNYEPGFVRFFLRMLFTLCFNVDLEPLGVTPFEIAF